MVWTKTQVELAFGDATNRGTLSGTQTIYAHPLYYRLEECKTAASSAITYRLPDATTLPLGGIGGGPMVVFLSDATGSEDFTVADSTGSAVATVSPGESCKVWLLSNSTAAGSWAARTRAMGAHSVL